jgi:hypothetical protein
MNGIKMKFFRIVLLSQWTTRILYIAIGIFLGMFISAILIDNFSNLNIVEILKATSPIAILLSVMLASRQFVYNTEWNKKDAANRALYESQKNISQYMSVLGKYYDVRECMRNKRVISIQDIHNLMGVFVKNGVDKDGKEVYKFVFNGSLIDDNDIKNIHNKKTTGYVTSFDRNKNGKEIERTLLSLLNEYEYICLSTRKEIFDKETVIELIGPSIAAAFIVFQDYIMHLRVDSRHGNGRYSVYKEIEDMYKEIQTYKGNVFNLDIINIPPYDSTEADKRYKVPFRISSDHGL